MNNQRCDWNNDGGSDLALAFINHPGGTGVNPKWSIWLASAAYVLSSIANTGRQLSRFLPVYIALQCSG